MQQFKAFIFLCFFSIHIFSQQTYNEKTYQHQISLQHDNDFIMLTDYYYSSGLYLTYSSIVSKAITKTYSEQVSLRLGQEIYTPSQTQTTNSDVFDRPYAGFTGMAFKWSAAKKNHLLGMEIEMGIAGVNSGAGGFQRWYHKAIAISNSPIWTDEIDNTFHTNLYLDYAQEWTISKNPFGIRFAIIPKVAFGSRDIYVEPATVISFGRRTHISKSITFNRLGSNEREIYFAFRFAYRNVLQNSLIEGTIFGDESEVLRESKTSIFLFGFDFNHRFNQHDYKVGFRFNTAETPLSSSHKYILLSYGRSF